MCVSCVVPGVRVCSVAVEMGEVGMMFGVFMKDVACSSELSGRF